MHRQVFSNNHVNMNRNMDSAISIDTSPTVNIHIFVLMGCHWDATGVSLGCHWELTGMPLGCQWIAEAGTL